MKKVITYGPCFLLICLHMGLGVRKPVLGGSAYNTGAEQPAQSDQRLCYSLIGKYYI